MFTVSEPKLSSRHYVLDKYGLMARSMRKQAPLALERLDRGILPIVKILVENGVETFESCEGGEGHAFYEPTVRFHGGHAEGFRALAVALQHGLRVCELRRYYSVEDGEPVGPHWEMTFLLGAIPLCCSTGRSPCTVVSRPSR
jgi:hypothetical protein